MPGVAPNSVGIKERTLMLRKENSKSLKITIYPNTVAGINNIQPIIRNLFGNKKFVFIIYMFNYYAANVKYNLHIDKEKLQIVKNILHTLQRIFVINVLYFE